MAFSLSHTDRRLQHFLQADYIPFGFSIANTPAPHWHLTASLAFIKLFKNVLITRTKYASGR